MRVNRGIIAVLFGGLLIMLCQSGYAYFPNGIYVTAGGSYGSIVIDEISGSTSTQNEATLTKDNTTESASGIIAAIGYAFETEAIRLELAYAARQDVEYNVNPVFTSPVLTSGNLKSDVDVKTLMFNGYVDLHMSEYFVPYVTAGAGGARNRVGLTATGSGGTFADSNIDYSFAWQAGVGVHVKVVNNFFVNLEFHHVELGSAEWGPWGPVRAKMDSDKVSANEGLLTFTVFFGNQDAKNQPPTLLDSGTSGNKEPTLLGDD